MRVARSVKPPVEDAAGHRRLFGAGMVTIALLVVAGMVVWLVGQKGAESDPERLWRRARAASLRGIGTTQRPTSNASRGSGPRRPANGNSGRRSPGARPE